MVVFAGFCGLLNLVSRDTKLTKGELIEMIYHDKEQAQLEIDMNVKSIPGRWVIAEYDGQDGRRIYEPIRTCPLCGERSHKDGQRC